MKLSKLERMFLESNNGDVELTVDQFVEVCKENGIEISVSEVKKMNKYIHHIYSYGYGTLYGSSKSKIFDITRNYIRMLDAKIYDKNILIEINKSLNNYEDKYKKLSPIDRITYENELFENCIYSLDCVREHIQDREQEKQSNYLNNYK